MNPVKTKSQTADKLSNEASSILEKLKSGQKSEVDVNRLERIVEELVGLIA